MTLCDAVYPFLLAGLVVAAGCRDPEASRLEKHDRSGPPPAARAAPPEPRAVHVRVRDSGIEPDDAFELEVDGVGHGETPIGGERIFSLWLAPGEHTVRVRGAGSPDGQGTYGVEFDGPLKVLEGPPLVGAGLNKGMSCAWKVKVE